MTKNFKNLFLEMEPSEDAALTEWKEWAQNLKKEYVKKENSLIQSNTKLKKVKKDVEEKDKVLSHYKQKINNLENTISSIKNNKFYRIIKYYGYLESKVRLLFKH